MAKLLNLASELLTGVGVVIAVIGAVALGVALIMPKSPPPAMNEGHALLGVLGFAALLIGGGVAALGWFMKHIGMKGVDATDGADDRNQR